MALHCLPVLALVSSRAWTVAGWTMLHFLWVGAAFGLLAALLRILLRRASPQQRYVAALVLFSLLALAPLGIAVRVSQSLADESQPRSTPVSSEARDTRSSGEEQPQTEAASSAAAGRTRAATHERTISAGSDFTTDRHQSAARAVTGSGTDPRLAWIRNVIHGTVGMLPGFWIAGSSVLLALTLAGLHGADRLRRRSQPLLDGDLVARCSSLACSLRISRRVALAVCDRLAGPVLVGVVRPCILLPTAALTGWTPQQLELVLLHELAHIRRWDNLVNLVQRLVEAVFFQPAVWWVSNWMRLEREQCCDVVVVRRTGRPREYAQMLLTLTDAFHRSTPLATDGYARRVASLSMARSHLVPRIRHLLTKGPDPMQTSRAASLFVLATIAALVLLPWGWHEIATRAEDPRSTSIAEPQSETPPAVPDGENRRSDATDPDKSAPRQSDSPAPDRSAPPQDPGGPGKPAAEQPEDAASAASETTQAASRKLVWPVTINDARVSPGQTVVLSSKGEGVLESVAVRAGEAVRKGQTVASLPKDARSIAALQVARAELAGAEKVAAFARADHNRINRLSERNAVSQDQAAKSQANADQAEAQFAQATARLAQAEAQLEFVHATLQIRSPIDGIVTRVHHHHGESVNVGDPVVEVVTTDRMQVEGWLPYWYVWSIQSGAPVTVRVEIPGLDLPIEKETFAGRLTYVDPSIRPLDRQFQVLAEVENRRELLKSGLQVIMTIKQGEADSGTAPKETNPRQP